jgi:hypothetical protein
MRFAPKLPLLTMIAALATPAFAQTAEDQSSIQVLFAATGAKTERGSDAAALSALKVGYRPNPWLEFHLFNRFGYGAENKRLLTFISLGTQLTMDLGAVNPYFRFALAHQHEERASTFGNNPIGSILGFSAGIHHRGGLEGALGIELPLTPIGELQAFAAIEASTIYFLDSNGPRLYAGGTAGLGINYSL